MASSGSYSWSLADQKASIVVESTGEKYAKDIGPCNITFGDRVNLYLSNQQAETLCYSLCDYLAMSRPVFDDPSPGKNAIEELIVARDNLLSACANLGIVKESEVSNESV